MQFEVILSVPDYILTNVTEQFSMFYQKFPLFETEHQCIDSDRIIKMDIFENFFKDGHLHREMA